jgi:hypothetical protein
MRNMVSSLLLLTVASTGCGVDAEVAEDTLQHRITWTQAAETEIQDCHVFKLDNLHAVEVNRLQVEFAAGSHHVHIYRASEPEADSVKDCFKGIDWQKWSLVLGAQTQAMDWQLPEGVTIPFAPRQQLLVQVHWLNTTRQAETSNIDISFHTTRDSREHLGTVFGVNKRIDIGPQQNVRTEAFCQVPEGAKLHALMGHFHAHGKDYRVIERMPNATAGTEIYFAKDEPSFEFKTYAPAREVQRGAGFQYECGFHNYENFRLTWGSDTATQEHCNMTAYFSPAEEVSKFCVLEPSKLAAVTPAQDVVRAGQDVTIAIELLEADRSDLEIALASSDVTALEVPASVRVPAGQRFASFVAHTRRPAQVEVSASMAGTTISRPIKIRGLVISELFYNPATGMFPNQLQWVEIANESNVAIDLSKYSLGAGTNDFLRTRLNLPMTIPARGCVVIGGPESSPANHSPVFSLAQDFSPDLQVGGSMAAGISLFSTTVEGMAMTPTMRPLDVLVYGGDTTVLRGPDGNIAPIWQGSIPGGSIRRVTDNIWEPTTAPTPGTCEILNAQ